MSMTRCQEGLHFYDADKHATCPYCRQQSTEHSASEDSTRAVQEDSSSTVGVYPNSAPGGTQGGHLPTVPVSHEDDDGSTVGLFPVKHKFVPVTGWIVCVDGKECGKDYRIKPGINLVGRGDRSDIVIKGDPSISREEHAEIEYDYRENRFYLIRKKNPDVLLNGESVRAPTQLQAYDVIQFGQSVFVFIPFCSEKFQWAKKES